MSSLIQYQNIIDPVKGKIIYDKGENLRKISDFMENPYFRKFYEEISKLGLMCK